MTGRGLRWWKFNGVGLLGVGLQLMLLGFFEKWLRLGYLTATALAVELTVLHNFAWHENCVWRGMSGGRAERLLRFHLSNGLLSIVGNLALMRLLVGVSHWPSPAANLTAITLCSLINFCMAEWWVFAPAREA
jgi:putative flippase GtrA